MLQLLQNLNLGLAFFVELGMLAAFTWSGFSLHQNVYIKVLVGIVVPAVIIVFWGKFLAPNAGTRLHAPALEIAKFTLFGLAAAALWIGDHRTAGIIFGATSFANLLLAMLWHQV